MTGRNGARPSLWRVIGGVCLLAVLLGMMMAPPLMGAEIKTLDNLAKNLYAGEVRERSSKFAVSFAALQAAVETLNGGEEISSVFKINSLSERVALCRQAQRRGDEALKSLTGYIAANSKKLGATGLEELLPLAELEGKAWQSYDRALTEYLSAFYALLEYSRDNMPALRAGREAERKEYERLFNGYVAAADRESRADAEWQEFRGEFGRRHPELNAYLKTQNTN